MGPESKIKVKWKKKQQQALSQFPPLVVPWKTTLSHLHAPPGF